MPARVVLSLKTQLGIVIASLFHAMYFADAKSIKSVCGSSSELSLPKTKGEEQAYVPYVFARDTVVRIVNDMHKMKDNHVNIINQIELNYRMIEDETQVNTDTLQLQ